MEKVQYKNALVSIETYDCGLLPEVLQKTCFCCNKKINNCNATLLINDHIPNIVMHTDCFKMWENKIDELCDDITSAHDYWRQLGKIFEK